MPEVTVPTGVTRKEDANKHLVDVLLNNQAQTASQQKDLLRALEVMERAAKYNEQFIALQKRDNQIRNLDANKVSSKQAEALKLEHEGLRQQAALIQQQIDLEDTLKLAEANAQKREKKQDSEHMRTMKGAGSHLLQGFLGPLSPIAIMAKELKGEGRDKKAEARAKEIELLRKQLELSQRAQSELASRTRSGGPSFDDEDEDGYAPRSSKAPKRLGRAGGGQGTGLGGPSLIGSDVTLESLHSGSITFSGPVTITNMTLNGKASAMGPTGGKLGGPSPMLGLTDSAGMQNVTPGRKSSVISPDDSSVLDKLTPEHGSVSDVGIGGVIGGPKFEGEPKFETIKKFEPGSALIVKTLKHNEILDEETNKKKANSNWLDSLLGGLGAAMAGGIPAIAELFKSKFAKMTGAALIAGGVAMMVINGLKGMNKAEDWHVDGLSGFIGGFLGGTESGWKGAVENMVPGALTGAGIGLMFGPIGMIVGGLLGAAVGAILGYIGGEEIAKQFQKTTQTVGDTLTGKSFKEGNASSGMLWQNAAATPGTLIGQSNFDFLKKNSGNEKKKTIDEFAARDSNDQAKTILGIMDNPGNLGAKYLDEELTKEFGVNYGKYNIPALVKKSKNKKLESDWNTLLMQNSDRGIYDMQARGLIESKEDYEAVYGDMAPSTLALNKLKRLFPGLDKSSPQALLPFADKWANFSTRQDILGEINPISGLPKDRWVKDAIITKSGQIIHTDPDDNLYAFKNIPDLNKGGAAGSRANGNFAQYEKASQFDEKSLDRLGDKIIEAMKSIQPNVVSQQTNNYSDRFSSDNLLNSITMEVR